MASMYLLKNPDHYTNHQFQTFYWPNYVQAARHVWNSDHEKCGKDQLVLLKMKGKIMGHTYVHDYVFQLVECNQMSLYDWFQLSVSLSKKCPNKIGPFLILHLHMCPGMYIIRRFYYQNKYIWI